MKVAPNYGKCLRYRWQRSQDAPKRHIKWRWEHYGIFARLSRSLSNPMNGVQIMTKAKRDIDVDASLRAACVEMG